MAFRNLLAAAAAAAIAIGAGFELRTAQSLTIPDACVLGAGDCAAVCRSLDDQSGSPADFVALAAYQLGPERPILMPPANLTMPAPVDPHNVYAGAGAGMFSPAVAGQPSRVYSPNLVTGKVDVIDPQTFKVIDSLPAIPSPEHIVPSWDLQTLWVSADVSARGGHGGVAPIDPRTGKIGKAIDVPDSYNIYFTPDGASAIIVAEAMRRLEFRDPHTMALQGYIATPKCAGINHADFAPDGAYAIFTCEFNDFLAKIDLVHHTLVETLPLTPGHMPQDIRVAPDGKIFFVADLIGDGVMVIDGDSFGQLGYIKTGDRRARALPEPRRDEALCLQSRNPQPGWAEERAGQRVGDRLRHPQGRRQLAGSGRRQPGHGKRQRRRQMAVAIGPLRRRRLRLQHRRRRGEDDSGRRNAAWPHGLAAARALFAGPYRQYALTAPRRLPEGRREAKPGPDCNPSANFRQANASKTKHNQAYPSKFACLCLDLFGGIEAYQGVTWEKSKTFSDPAGLARQVVVRVFSSLSSTRRSAGRGLFLLIGRRYHSFCFCQLTPHSRHDLNSVGWRRLS